MECRETRRRRRRRRRNSCGQADGRASGPIKGIARGPRGPKKKPGYLLGERVDHNGQVNWSTQIQKHYKVDCSRKVIQKLQKNSKKQNKYKKHCGVDCSGQVVQKLHKKNPKSKANTKNWIPGWRESGPQRTGCGAPASAATMGNPLTGSSSDDHYDQPPILQRALRP